MACKICNAPLSTFGTARILDKMKCNTSNATSAGSCRQDPHWLEEAYATAITGSDLGLISRNLAVARISESVITIMFDPKARFVDYGGGLGFYVRLMRDRGFDFYYWDRYAQPMFARGFEVGGGTGSTYELLTAFEVFEHLVEPISDARRC